ncbi:hypothetical protein PVAP13_8NG046200 [Panicum virgatum]|uniref:Nodulation-signaling pathway 2 protein-like n=1 Tax=Panicum virgatum TaxID=38727 RepID=A0A8T0P4K2_PANVG|nr:hypothetical protein PVAP13_8NG046200 [Panicum virgatum]
METMSYPCSPLLSFPIHEESSYSLWSPQLAHHENSSIDSSNTHGHENSSAFPYFREDCEFFDTTAIDSSDTHGQNAFHVDVFTHCPERLLQKESGNLVTIQEELMEENSLSDLLLTGAEAVEAGDSSLASVVFSKLDEILPVTFENAAASSFDRLAYHFFQGLQSRMSGASFPCYPPEPEQSGTMSVHQMIQELSPFVKFTHFTANQAILDATSGDTDVHIIDFNLSEGIQWSSLMSDLARQAARCLAEFAESLNLPFQYSSLCMHNKEDMEDFSRNREGSMVVSCDTTNLCYKSWSKLQMLLLSCVKNLQPKLVVIIEEELVKIGKEACGEGYGGAKDTGLCGAVQARMLVGLFNRSFGVTHEKGRLQLCWKSRPLISVSVWTPV